MAIYRGPGGAGDATGDATNASALALAAKDAAQASAAEASSSATAASNSATAADTSADAAAASATSAASSASGASTSATNAANSASDASDSATAAASSATDAASSATAAASSASAASTSASSASSSASAASTSASNASTSATNASNSASSASTSASNAATSATNAAASATLAASYTPSQTGNSGKFLTTDGTSTSWGTVSYSALTGTVPTWNQNTTGSAATLTTGRTIAITGDITYTSGSFNGSGNVTGTGTLATVNSNVGSYGSSTTVPVVTVNGKGLVTAVSTTTIDPGINFKNRIINGAMMIDQRNAGASVTSSANGTYFLDRWRNYQTANSKFSVQQSSTAPTGFTKSMLITSLSAYSIGAGDILAMDYRIEGNNVADLAWGTASASPVTLSFWVRSSLTGTFGGSVSNSAGNRSYPFSYTVNSANTFEYKTVTIAGDTSGTWLTDTGIGIELFFSLGTGSTYSGTAGSWAGAQYMSATGATSVVGTSGATFYITGVQLEKASTATSFDYRPYGTELALCQRYYQTIGNISGSVSLLGGMNSASRVRTSMPFGVVMRSSPSFTLVGTPGFYYYGTGSNPTYSSINNTAQTSQSFMVDLNVTGGSGAGSVCEISFGSSSFNFSAEL